MTSAASPDTSEAKLLTQALSPLASFSRALPLRVRRLGRMDARARADRASRC